MNSKRAAGFAALLILSAAASAREPEESWPSFTGIVEVMQRTWDGVHGGFSSQGQPMILPLGSALHQNYEAQVDPLTANVVAELQKQGLYDVKLNLDQDIDSITVAPSNSGIRFACFLHKNTLHFTSTTNSFLGSWADPTFDATFDLKVVIDLSIGPSTSPMTVTGPGSKQVTVQPIEIRSVTATPFNLVAKTDNVLVGIVKALNLVDFGKYFPKSIGIGGGAFDQALANALPFVKQAAGQGYTAMEADLASPKASASNVNVFLTKSNIPTSGNGTISGKITWPATQGYPGYADTTNYTWPIMPDLVAGFPILQVEMPYTTYHPTDSPCRAPWRSASSWPTLPS